jgi:hypothetical protein
MGWWCGGLVAQRREKRNLERELQQYIDKLRANGALHRPSQQQGGGAEAGQGRVRPQSALTSMDSQGAGTGTGTGGMGSQWGTPSPSHTRPSTATTRPSSGLSLAGARPHGGHARGTVMRGSAARALNEVRKKP